MRPRSLDEYLGQDHLLGPGAATRSLLDADPLPSLLLWGPPGSGKTTLAELVAARAKAQFVRFSAVTGGVPELREVIKAAKDRLRVGERTVLFVDEIHRFNKAQQDALLPHVEDGTVILVGATTENPSFALNPALLSRLRVLALRALSDDAIRDILNRALVDPERGLGLPSDHLGSAELGLLVHHAAGDARRGLNALEAIAGLERRDTSAIAEVLERPVPYDKDGEEHYDVISAFIKSVRGSDPDAALYWLARMIEGGEDPRFIARRLVILASEDVGNADFRALLVANAAMQAVEFIGMPEGRIPLAQATTYLASAPKSNASYKAINEAIAAVRDRALPVPLHLRNAPTKLAKELGHGREYRYPHDYPGAHLPQSYWPEGMKGRRFYRPTAHGDEARLKRRLEELRQAEDPSSAD